MQSNPRLLIVLTLVALTIALALFMRLTQPRAHDLTDSFHDCVKYHFQHACMAVQSRPEAFYFHRDGNGHVSVCHAPASPHGRTCFDSIAITHSLARNRAIGASGAAAWVNALSDR